MFCVYKPITSAFNLQKDLKSVVTGTTWRLVWGRRCAPMRVFLHVFRLELTMVDLPLLLYLLPLQPLGVRSGRVVHQSVLQQRAEHERYTNLKFSRLKTRVVSSILRT